MWSRRILVGVIGLLAGLFDATVAVWFPGAWFAVRLALPLVVILAAFSSRDRALIGGVMAGVVLDVLLPSFGLITIRYLLIGLVIHAVAQQYLTNRTLLGSLALGAVGPLLDRGLLAVITFIRGWFGSLFIPEARAPLFAELAWMLAVMAVIFLLFVAFTKRFMPLLIRRA